MQKYLWLSVLIFLTSARDLSLNAFEMPIQPPLLKKGDKVAIVAPAFGHKNSEKYIKAVANLFKSWGLKVGVGKHASAKYYMFAGTDEQRTSDLQWALDDPTIRAIFCLRGGYGTTRIIDQLDFTGFLRSPKWVIGFSDITTLHIQLHNLGAVSVHGEVLKSFLDPQHKASIDSLQILLFQGNAHLIACPSVLNRIGSVTAPVVGGNLTLICNNMGTPSALDTKNRILFIEDVGENLYAIDRMMVQLKRAGKLQHLAGLIVGNMTDMKENPENSFGKSAEEIIQEHVADYGYPVAFQLPIGHEAPNLAFPHGSPGTLCVQDNEVSLSFESK